MINVTVPVIIQRRSSKSK